MLAVTIFRIETCKTDHFADKVTPYESKYGKRGYDKMWINGL